MPTYSFTRTLPQMRALILRKLRVIGNSATPSGNQAAIVDEAIDLRLKELHALGVLWFNVSGATSDLTLVAGTATASLSALTDFLYPITAKLRIGSEDKPIDIISHREYQAIPDKTERGEPEKMMVSGGTAYFWPTPDDNYTVKLTYQAIAADTESPTAPDVAVSMMRSLVTMVAADLIDDFAVPEQRAQRLILEAQSAARTLRTLNSERVDSTTVEMQAF
jgi:hypothetical protein